MNIHEQLRGIGMSDSEIKVYLFLLETGISSPPVIARNTKIARSNLHVVLKDLLNMGLVKRRLQNKRYLYIPTDPSITLHILDERRKAMESALYELTARYKSQKNKPVIKFYEGIQEIKHIFEELLEAKNKKVFGFTSTARLFELFPLYFQSRFQKELKRKEIYLRDILSYDSKETSAIETKQNTGWMYDYKILNKKYGELRSNILVWDDKVAVMTLEEPVFGTVTTSAALADTYRVQFNILWDALPGTPKPYPADTAH
ncbi:MAG: helix-turn-helix domain-containing protein [bacterium]|nr:helix-turn-helix domain-containing protein [bacterium]